VAGGSGRRSAKKLLGVAVMVVIGGCLLVVLFVAGRVFWIALRDSGVSVPTHAATETGTASLKLVWDKSPDPSVTGYKILYGTQPGVYADSLTVGDQASATLTNLRNATKYYIVAVAVDAHGNQSPPSNEIEVVTSK